MIAGALALEHLTKNPDSEFAKVLIYLLDNYAEERSRYLFPFLPKRDGSQIARTSGRCRPCPSGRPVNGRRCACHYGARVKPPPSE